jgi:hypothetical protein
MIVLNRSAVATDRGCKPAYERMKRHRSCRRTPEQPALCSPPRGCRRAEYRIGFYRGFKDPPNLTAASWWSVRTGCRLACLPLMSKDVELRQGSMKFLLGVAVHPGLDRIAVSRLVTPSRSRSKAASAGSSGPLEIDYTEIAARRAASLAFPRLGQGPSPAPSATLPPRAEREGCESRWVGEGYCVTSPAASAMRGAWRWSAPSPPSAGSAPCWPARPNPAAPTPIGRRPSYSRGCSAPGCG